MKLNLHSSATFHKPNNERKTVKIYINYTKQMFLKIQKQPSITLVNTLRLFESLNVESEAKEEKSLTQHTPARLGIAVGFSSDPKSERQGKNKENWGVGVQNTYRKAGRRKILAFLCSLGIIID